MEWEKLPNGKFRPKKMYKKVNGKYQPDDPEWIKICRMKMKAKIIFCEHCKDFYNLLTPCIHHLPDTYENNKKKHDAIKARKKNNEEPIIDTAKLFDYSEN